MMISLGSLNGREVMLHYVSHIPSFALKQANLTSSAAILQTPVEGQDPYFLETPLHDRMGSSVDIGFHSDNAPRAGQTAVVWVAVLDPNLCVRV